MTGALDVDQGAGANTDAQCFAGNGIGAAYRTNWGVNIMKQIFSKIFALTAVVFMGMAANSAHVEAQTGGDAVRGASLAGKWCQSCHITDRRGTGSAVDPAPPFPTIASDPKKTRDYLRRWLSTSHPQMPDFNLGGREIEDLVSHIQSLAAP